MLGPGDLAGDLARLRQLLAEQCPPHVVSPRTQETFVLLRVDEYQRFKEDEYDDSPWTREELQALAWEAAERTGWEEYDNTPEKP